MNALVHPMPTIESLIDNQPPGHSLSRPFYCDPEIFTLDIERVFKRRWLLIDHASRIPNRGDFFVIEIAGESLIVVRDEKDDVSVLFNVCRHRGSRVCLEKSGHSARFTCTYHAWTYGLDGRLLAARQMPEGFDKKTAGLRRCPVEVVEGLIYAWIGEGPALDFEPARHAITPFLRLQGIANAKIAARESFRTQANWKLVVENFLECYHCLAAHPEYCAVNAVVKLIANGSELASAEFLAYWEKWKASLDDASLGNVIANSSPGAESFDPRSPYSLSHASMKEGAARATVFAAMRTPINEGYISMTEDGQPVAPLMGHFKAFDGGKTSVSIDYIGRMTAANDYAALFRFIPVSPGITDFEIIWLVRGDAIEGKDYDVSKLKWLWSVTTAQDKVLAENNQKGVESWAYVPGPYSLLEDSPNRFVQWYLEQVDPRLDREVHS